MVKKIIHVLFVMLLLLGCNQPISQPPAGKTEQSVPDKADPKTKSKANEKMLQDAANKIFDAVPSTNSEVANGVAKAKHKLKQCVAEVQEEIENIKRLLNGEDITGMSADKKDRLMSRTTCTKEQLKHYAEAETMQVFCYLEMALESFGYEPISKDLLAQYTAVYIDWVFAELQQPTSRK